MTNQEANLRAQSIRDPDKLLKDLCDAELAVRYFLEEVSMYERKAFDARMRLDKRVQEETNTAGANLFSSVLKGVFGPENRAPGIFDIFGQLQRLGESILPVTSGQLAVEKRKKARFFREEMWRMLNDSPLSKRQKRQILKKLDKAIKGYGPCNDGGLPEPPSSKNYF